MRNIFDIAVKDRYIDFNPAFNLNKEFPTSSNFLFKHQQDNRMPSITDEDLLKEFIKDLKNDNKMDIATKRAIYIHILSANRPSNTVEAEWNEINFDDELWIIPAKKMKMRIEHIIPLSSYMLKILQEQHLFTQNKQYVFVNKGDKHINRDTLSKAFRNLANNKYNGIVTPHGFRATFRTLCSKNKSKLLNLGISEEAIEESLSHKEVNPIKFSYEREKSTIEQRKRLMQWYGDYLNEIEPLF